MIEKEKIVNFTAIAFVIIVSLLALLVILPVNAYADDGSTNQNAIKTVKSRPGTWQYIPVLSQDDTDNIGGVSRDMSFRVLLNNDVAPAGSDVYAKMKYGGFETVPKTDNYTGFHLWGTFTLVVNGKEITDKEPDDAKAVFHRVPISADGAKNNGSNGISGLTYVKSDKSFNVFLSNGENTPRRYTAAGDPITFKPTLHNVTGATAKFEIYAGKQIEDKQTSSTASIIDELHRLYNPNSGEHFYTAKTTERDNLVKAGWKYEGIAWKAPKSSKTPVYRLYSGTDHHYTTNTSEKDALIKAGWKYEGISWYSDDNMSISLHRVYNPNVNPNAKVNNSGSHHYTTSRNEVDSLVSKGWKYENIGWYGTK